MESSQWSELQSAGQEVENTDPTHEIFLISFWMAFIWESLYADLYGDRALTVALRFPMQNKG